MNIKKYIFSVCLFALCFDIVAQENNISEAINTNMRTTNKLFTDTSSVNDLISFWKGWSIDFRYGITKFKGDVSQYDHYPAYQEEVDFSELGSAFVFSINKQINAFYSISSEMVTGKFSGLRRGNGYAGYEVYDPYENFYEKNGDKFTTSFYEIDAILNMDISNAMSYFFKSKKNKYISLEGRIGVGYNIFNSVRTNLFSDTYIYSFGYADEGPEGGNVKKTILESPSSTSYLYGARIKSKLNSRLNLLLDYTVRNGSDKWDASIMTTQNTSDNFALLSLGISYKIGNHDYKKEWESPIDGLKEGVNELFVKIDGFTEDSDNDGVSDAFDKSPNTMLGVSIDGAGTPLDVDMDNVPDFRDADPFSNRGVQVDKNGVEYDDDKDGVPNSKDLETNTPKGVMVNQHGMQINNVSGGSIAYFPSLYFDLGSAFVHPSNIDKLATIAVILKYNNIKLDVIGHTDFTGSSETNKSLGMLRANNVIKILVNDYNIDPSRLLSVTKGEEDPLINTYNEKNESGNSVDNINRINRRVDFKISY